MLLTKKELAQRRFDQALKQIESGKGDQQALQSEATRLLSILNEDEPVKVDAPPAKESKAPKSTVKPIAKPVEHPFSERPTPNMFPGGKDDRHLELTRMSMPPLPPTIEPMFYSDEWGKQESRKRKEEKRHENRVRRAFLAWKEANPKLVLDIMNRHATDYTNYGLEVSRG
jgi:hypothetical protein